MLKFDVITTFPEMFEGPLKQSILGRAQEKGLIEIRIHNLRDYTTDKHQVTDDYPYGGGAGMVMKPEPIFAAVEALRCEEESGCRESVVLFTPQGERFDHDMAKELAGLEHLIFICGHYEGVDERVREHLADREVSIGDYVLTGGELPAMVVIDAVSRQLTGVVGAAEGPQRDSFAEGMLEHPHYTRPAEFRGWRVPEVLLSGNHAEIEKWRREQARKRTEERRPDLLRESRVERRESSVGEEE